MREIRTLRATRRGLETESRITLPGHEGGNPGDRQGESYGPPRQSSTLPTAPNDGRSGRGQPKADQGIRVFETNRTFSLGRYGSRLSLLDQHRRR